MRGVEINPFWSDKIKEEARLRSMRPVSLPPDGCRGRRLESARPRETQGQHLMRMGGSRTMPAVDLEQEVHGARHREGFQTGRVVALVLQQNSELQKEVFALRQGQEANEKKKEDTVCVGLTYGASLCSGLGFGSTPISTGVSLEGLVGV